jgi:predicted nucleic acid-binding protein
VTTLVDSSVLLDVLATSPWREWSEEHLALAAESGPLAINQVVYAEVAVGFADRGQLERTLQGAGLARVGIPWAASWLVARAFREYRHSGGARATPLPDFFIGARAEAAGLPLLTRDPAHVRTYFPQVGLLAPE